MVRNIFLKRNLSINNRLFRFNYYVEFLIFFQLIRRFFKFFKCRLFNDNSRKSAKIFVNNEKPE